MLTVSVVVAVYNGASTISLCLDSLLKQTTSGISYEILVVDNASTDDTERIVRQYPVRLLSCRQRGPAVARNAGIAASKADIVAFTDADCIAAPSWLSELIKPYADSQVGGTAGLIRSYSPERPTLVGQFSSEHEPLVNFISGPAEFLPHLYTANGSYRRDVLNQVEGFNPGLITGEDVDLSWRVQLKTGRTVHYVPTAVVQHYHRQSYTGLCKQYRQYGFGEILLDTIYGHYPNYPRTFAYQLRRLMGQSAVLPRYLVAALLGQLRYLFGRRTAYEAARPWLWFLIESSNIRGKLEALLATRGMREAQRVLRADPAAYIRNFY